jgi:hypothetical protein
VTPEHADRASRSEVIDVHPRRASISWEEWFRLFSLATTVVDVLVYAGLFLPEQTPWVVELMNEIGFKGAQIRSLLGHTDLSDVKSREQKKVLAWMRWRPRYEIATPVATVVAGGAGCAGAVARSTLCTSIYRSDDVMIANTHVLGRPAAQAPAIRLRRLSGGGLFETYATMFDRVWGDAEEAWG